MNSNLPLNFTTHQPLIYSPLKIDDCNILIAPGAPQFLTTESELKITTENAQALTTEG